MTSFFGSGGEHSDIDALPSKPYLDQLWGQDLTPYFPVPLTLGCPGLVADPNMKLEISNMSNINVPLGIHKSGVQQSITDSKLAADDWYTAWFLPKMFYGQNSDGIQLGAMHELVMPNQVKFKYVRAIAKVHPDK
ncbi:hypothetical protein FRC07_008319, partial [Ceratobasidium sp. 392]